MKKRYNIRNTDYSYTVTYTHDRTVDNRIVHTINNVNVYLDNKIVNRFLNVARARRWARRQ